MGFMCSLGLILWIGVGYQIYKSPILGVVPSSFTTEECSFLYPLFNQTVDSFVNITSNHTAAYTKVTHESINSEVIEKVNQTLNNLMRENVT